MEEGHIDDRLTLDQESIEEILDNVIDNIAAQLDIDREQMLKMGWLAITYQDLLSRHSNEPIPENRLAIVWVGESPAVFVFQSRNENNRTLTQVIPLEFKPPIDLNHQGYTS